MKRKQLSQGNSHPGTTEEISQDTERKQLSKGNPHPGDHRGRDRSGHRKKATERGTLTNWKPQREEQVITWKESNQVRSTHKLETIEGETSQDMKESNQARGTHQLETTEGETS